MEPSRIVAKTAVSRASAKPDSGKKAPVSQEDRFEQPVPPPKAGGPRAVGEDAGVPPAVILWDDPGHKDDPKV